MSVIVSSSSHCILHTNIFPVHSFLLYLISSYLNLSVVFILPQTVRISTLKQYSSYFFTPLMFPFPSHRCYCDPHHLHSANLISSSLPSHHPFIYFSPRLPSSSHLFPSSHFTSPLFPSLIFSSSFLLYNSYRRKVMLGVSNFTPKRKQKPSP